MNAQTGRNPAGRGRAPLIAFILFVLLTAGAAVAIRMTYQEMAPFWSGASRQFLAATLMWIIVLARRTPVPRGRALAGAVLYGVLAMGLSFVFGAWGLTKTPAGRYQVLLATIPLLSILFAFVHGVERPTARGLAGGVMAVAGIAVLFGETIAGPVSVPHMLSILLSAAFVAETGVLLKRFPPVPPLMTNAIGLPVGATVLLMASIATREPLTMPSRPAVWFAYLYLIIGVSVASYLLYLFALSRWSATATSYSFVMRPPVTVAIAAVVAAEPVGPRFMLGAGLVLAGALIGALLPRRR